MSLDEHLFSCLFSYACHYVVAILSVSCCNSRQGEKIIDTLATIRELAAHGDVRISEHGYEEMANDDILVDDILDGVQAAILVEDYPLFGKGPSLLALQRDRDGNPIHVVWGLPRGHSRPAVVITAYRPDPKRWSANYMERRK